MDNNPFCEREREQHRVPGLRLSQGPGLLSVLATLVRDSNGPTIKLDDGPEISQNFASSRPAKGCDLTVQRHRYCVGSHLFVGSSETGTHLQRKDLRG
jgi:hypothetical protein